MRTSGTSVNALHAGSEAGANDVSHALSGVALAVLGPPVCGQVLCFRDSKYQSEGEQNPAYCIENGWSEEVSE